MSYKAKRVGALICMFSLLTALLGCAGNTSETSNAANKDTTSEISAPVTNESGDLFSAMDKEIGYDETSAIYISLLDSGSVVNTDSKSSAALDSVLIDADIITIVKGGVYVVSGTLSNGQIVIDAKDANVKLVLSDANIANENSAAVYVKKADKVFVTLADNTVNTLSTNEEYVDSEDNVDAVIFSKSDLTINGNGTLNVIGKCGNGIVSKDDLIITGGNVNVDAKEHGLSGKDSVRIANGNINITSGKDGIHSKNDDTEKGFIYIEDGNIVIASDGDGIDASGMVFVEKGNINIVSGGGYVNGETKVEEAFGFNREDGGFMMPSQGGFSNDGEMPNFGEMPGNGEEPNFREIPGGGERPESGEMQGNGEMPIFGEMPGTGERPDFGQMPGGGENPEFAGESVASIEKDDIIITSTDSDSSVSSKGIKADCGITINGGTINIDSSDDSVHSNKDISINGGIFNISSGDDGIHANENLVLNGGTIDVTNSYEGLEGMTITINGGVISIVSNDDGVNASEDNSSTETGGFNRGGFGASENTWIEINGGIITINSYGDGIDSNGNLIVNGGEIYVDGANNGGNAAIDYGDGASATINGGVIVAVGYSQMAENFSENSTQGSMLITLDSILTGETVTLMDENGNEIASFKASKSFNSILISSEKIEAGKKYTLITDSTTTDVEMTSLVYSNQGSGFMGGGMNGNFHRGQR